MMPAVGDTIAPFTIVAEPAAMHVWAKVLHDPNPIHLDPTVVKAKGLGDRVINQGPANLAYIVNALHAAFPGGIVSVLDVRFLDNIYGGETVEASGAVTEIEPAGSMLRVSCRVWLRAGDRDVLGGHAVVLVPAKS